MMGRARTGDLGRADDPLWAPWQVILMPSLGHLALPTHPLTHLSTGAPGPRSRDAPLITGTGQR